MSTIHSAVRSAIRSPLRAPTAWKWGEEGGAGDETAPVLSSPLATATGSTTVDLGVTTDEAGGTLYWVVTTSATAPSAAQVAAGEDHAGDPAAAAGSQAVASAGAISGIEASGLTAATQYRAHYMHEDAAANRSAVVTSAATATSAAATQAWLDVMTSAPSAVIAGHLDTMVKGLKSDGVWAALRWISIGGLHHEQAARINGRQPAEVASAVNSPVFTAGQGWTGDDATAYLSSGVAGTALASTPGCGLWALVRTQNATRKGMIGYRTARGTIDHGGSTSVVAQMLASTVSQGGTSGNNQFCAVFRNDSTQELHVGSATVDTDTVSDDTLNQSNVIRFLSNVNVFSGAQLWAMGFCDGYLNETQRNALRTRIETLKAAIGS